MKKLIVLDGNSIMFRAYYATAAMGNLMQTRSGLCTNAIYGFVNMISHIIKTESPDNIFVAFDKGKKTFRHQDFASYKGTRKPTPSEFLMQIPYIMEFLDVVDIKHLALDDYEADDIVGSIATKFKNDFDEVMVVSGDKDLLQLAHDNIHVYLTKKGLSDLDCYTEDNFKEKMGIESSQLVDYKGLLGDSSDNLPGVTGIGPKTAVSLLESYHSLEGIYDHIDELKGKVKENLQRDKEVALKCKFLATLYTTIELDYTLESTKLNNPDLNKLRTFFEKIEFNSFIKRINDFLVVSKDSQSPIIDNTKEVFINSSVEYLNSQSELLINDLEKESIVLVDVAVGGENYHKENILGFSFVINNHGYFIKTDDLSLSNVLDILCTKDFSIYTIDSKKLYVCLNRLNYNLKLVNFDLVLASYIDNPSNGSSDIKDIYDKYLPNNVKYHNEVFKKKTTSLIPSYEELAEYFITRVSYLASYKKIIDEKLKEASLSSLLYDIEIPLAKVLSSMEISGFMIDKDRLKEIGQIVQDKMNELESSIYDIAGEKFNISSPKQLGEIIFDKLRLGKGKKNKTGYQTGADVLEKLVNVSPLPGKVLEYRKYSKIYNTYIVGLLDVCFDDNKVHTIFKQALTLTGRLSSVEPNIQNIPIRNEDGRVIRSAFIPSFKGGQLVSADYSQIELRILSHEANCKNMLDAFNSGVDLHSSTAAKIYQKNLDEVTKNERRMAKAVNFGIVYGMSSWGLAEELKISVTDAQTFIDKYFAIYPEITEYLDKVISFARINGYTTTMFNRRRYMPEINSSQKALREFAERTAKNAPIQGAAADIIKIAMINVYNKFNSLGLKSKLIAQVHDELVCDVHPDEVEAVKQILKETMEAVASLKVKLNAEVSFGYNWDMK